jgi:serine/threonine protein kinase
MKDTLMEKVVKSSPPKDLERFAFSLESVELEGMSFLIFPDHQMTLSTYLMGMRTKCNGLTLKKFGGDLISAVTTLIKRGLRHCDINPTNIWLDSSTRVHLANFTASPNTMDSVCRGSKYYLAPENRLGTANLRSDVYSLGLVLLQLYSGNLFNPQRYYEMMATQPDNAVKWREALFKRGCNNLSPDDQETFTTLVRGMLAESPSRRVSALKLENHPFFRNSLAAF